jgi:hypothetical protein
MLHDLSILTANYEVPLCVFSPVFYQATSCLLGPDIPLSTLLSDIPNLCYSHNVRDDVPHQYKAIGKITVFSILIYIFIC